MEPEKFICYKIIHEVKQPSKGPCDVVPGSWLMESSDRILGLYSDGTYKVIKDTHVLTTDHYRLNNLKPKWLRKLNNIIEAIIK